MAGVVSLMFELLQVRLLSFFIGKSMDVLAIPIALLGLAIGSMFRHFLFKGEPIQLLDRLSVAVLPTAAASLLAFFFVANTVFPEIHVTLATPGSEAAKVVVYGALFLPPYVLFGALLSTLFACTPERIGTLYFFDLAGAALGCALSPLLLTWFGLPTTIAAVLTGALLLALTRTITNQTKGMLIAGLLVCFGLLNVGVGFEEKVDATVLARVFGDLRKDGAREVDVRWNAIARTSLLTNEGKPRDRFVIVQDNGLSNVQVTKWTGEIRPDAADKIGQRSMPFRIGLNPQNILITFAGMGRDMIMMDELAGGKASITGVELNPTVVEWANHPALSSMGLPEFFSKPGIHLLAREGRDFLNTDEGMYDLIFIANNGAVHAGRTGHTRKFLDTREAMEAYLARLQPNGIMMFMNQPIMEKLASLREIWEANGRTDFNASVYVYGNGSPTLDTFLFKPAGFTEDDRRTIAATVKDWKLKDMLTPTGQGVQRLTDILNAPIGEVPSVTDDKPFTHRIAWESFTLVPDPDLALDSPYVSGWAKVFTVLVFGGVSGLVAVIAVLRGTPEQRVPPRWALYLLLSGVGYMCVQIPLIAKTELLVGNPLYAVSVNLAVFLIFNALGAGVFERRPKLPPIWLALAVGAAAAWGLVSMSYSIEALLSTPLIVKAFFVAVFVGPVAFVMGMFYPWCVTELTRAEQAGAVPMTYGLTTLASVLGSAFAMAAVINLGFTTVIALGVVLYTASAFPGRAHG